MPTRPTKKTDTRSKNFTGDFVEVDAIPAPILRQMVEEAITSHVNVQELELLEQIENEERNLLTRLARTVGR